MATTVARASGTILITVGVLLLALELVSPGHGLGRWTIPAFCVLLGLLSLRVNRQPGAPPRA